MFQGKNYIYIYRKKIWNFWEELFFTVGNEEHSPKVLCLFEISLVATDTAADK